MPYRQQRYIERSVERCFCEAAMAQRCRCCRRPRCRDHVRRGLCDRCGQAVDRQRPTRSAWAWTVGGGVAVTLTLVSMMLGTASGIVFGIPIAVVIAMATYHAMRARSIRALAPTLATTVGELAAPPREEEFPTPGGSGVGTGYPHLP